MLAEHIYIAQNFLYVTHFACYVIIYYLQLASVVTKNNNVYVKKMTGSFSLKAWNLIFY